MYNRNVVGLEEAQEAIQAMLKFVKDNLDKYWQSAAFAVVDEHGNLVCYSKMDGHSRIGPMMAIKKAYTAAIWRHSTTELLEFTKGSFIHDVNGGLPELQANAGQPNYEYGFTTVAGGLPILPPGQEKQSFRYAIGAIGVGGAGLGYKDEKVAMVGLKYIQNSLWPSEQ